MRKKEKEKEKAKKLVTRTFTEKYIYGIYAKNGAVLERVGEYESDVPATKATERKIATEKGMDSVSLVFERAETKTYGLEVSAFKAAAHVIEDKED